MHYNATLRVRELTQNIYDIGDEIAQFINHVSQSMADWDRELVEDCLHELVEVIKEGRAEVRPGLMELNGLRQAFISGIRAGQMSNTQGAPANYPHPARTLTFMHKPSSQRFIAEDDTEEKRSTGPANQAMASTAAWRIWLRERNEEFRAQLAELEEWVVEQTHAALVSQSVLLQQCFSQAERTTVGIVQQWMEMLERQPTLAAAMRGEAPPQFLEERARVDAIVNKLARAKRARQTSTTAV